MFKNNKIYKIDKNGKRKRVFYIKGLNVQFKGKNAAVIIHFPYIKFVKSRFILGNNSTIEIEGSIYEANKLLIDANAENSKCKIGKNFSASKNCKILNYIEPNLEINIKEECMFGENVLLRTSDAHAIFDCNNKVINKGKNILINKHCWLASNVNVLKGVEISEDSIVGAGSIVTKNLEHKNSIYAGIPCSFKGGGKLGQKIPF